MPGLILAERFPAPQSSTFIPVLAVLHAFSQGNQHIVSQSPASSGFYGSPESTQGAKSCLQSDCLLREAQGKARMWGLCPLTKHEYHSKSKSKQQGHCSLFFPSHKPLGSNVKSRNIRQGRGCHLSSANRELGAGSDAVTAAEGKAKIAQLVLVLLSSQESSWGCLICSGKTK